MSTKREETRLRILDAARKLLLERGFHGVGLEDVAAAAGVSRQAVYKSHFASKSELLLGLVRHVHETERLDELVGPALAAKAALQKLEETIRTTVLIEERVHDLSMMLSAAALSDADARAAWRDRMEVKRIAVGAAVVAVDRERRLSLKWTVQSAVDLLAVLVSPHSYHQLVVERGWSPDTLIRRVYEVCSATFLVEPRAGASRNAKRPRKARG